MRRKTESRRTWSNKMPLVVGIGSVIFLAITVGGWSMNVNITGAVLGKGIIQSAASKQAIQHPVGGVVSEVRVDNGDLIIAGDIVVRLDDTQLRTELKIIEGELYELLSKEARLLAEIDDTPELELHPLLSSAISLDPEVRKLVDRQRKHLFSRIGSLHTETELLRAQIKQVEKQIAGITAERSSKSRQKNLFDQELTDVRKLVKRRLMKKSDLYKLEKDRLAVEGELGKLAAKSAELEGKVSELELKLFSLGPKQREESIVELEKMRPLKTKSMEKRIGILDRLSKLEIRSPISGKIHDTQIEGLRSVVVAAKPLMFVVPRGKPLVVVVKVDATDIEQLFRGQSASVRFTAFNRRSTPTIQGDVTKISADAFLDPTKKNLYYEVEIALKDEEVKKLGSKPLIPGMPVDAFITTRSRSPFSYVTRPLVDYFDRAFRDG